MTMSKSKLAAWNEVDRIFPTDYYYDTLATSRAGYPVYRSPLDFYDYICDLGNRLEVNLHYKLNGRYTYNFRY